MVMIGRACAMFLPTARFKLRCDIEVIDHMKTKLALAGLLALLAAVPALSQNAEEQAKEFKRKGVQYQERGYLVKAIDQYQKAIEIYPQDASSHNNMGLALKDMDLLDDAENQLRAAIDLRPDEPKYKYNLGIVLMRKSNLPAAEEQFRKAIELKPKDPEMHFRLAQVQMLLGKPDQAEQEVRTAIDIKPYDPMYSELLGDILLRQVKTDAALTAYKRAAYIRGNKKDAVLINKLEYAEYLLGQKQATKQNAAAPPTSY
jgi:Tfp pilus assembly protein PilF